MPVTQKLRTTYSNVSFNSNADICDYFTNYLVTFRYISEWFLSSGLHNLFGFIFYLQ